MYVDIQISYGLRGQLMDTSFVVLDSLFEVTNMGQLYWLLGIQITFNNDLVELLRDAFLTRFSNGFT
jgi:hypothetical protein